MKKILLTALLSFFSISSTQKIILPSVPLKNNISYNNFSKGIPKKTYDLGKDVSFTSHLDETFEKKVIKRSFSEQKARAKKYVYITGFSSYYNCPVNSSQLFVDSLINVGYSGRVISTNSDSTLAFINNFFSKPHKENVLIMLGRSNSTKNIDVGLRANYFYNSNEDTLETVPLRFSSRKFFDLPSNHFLYLQKRFKENRVKYQLDDDIGNYVCNAAFYYALKKNNDYKNKIVFFGHIPSKLDEKARKNLEKAIISLAPN